MFEIITLINAGFSIISAIILFCSYAFIFKNINRSWIALLSCSLLLLALSALQVWHIRFLTEGIDLLTLSGYRFWLFMVPPMFFIFSRAILLPAARNTFLLVLHLVPLLFNFIPRYEVAIVLLFVVGTGYAFWFATLVYGLRVQRMRFRFEMFFFGFFALLAVFVLAAGILVPYIDNAWFYYFYSNSIALSFILIVTALLIFPDLLNDIATMATLSYASTTLKDIDVDVKLQELDRLMTQGRLYQNENLNLAMLAEALELSSHQLSELINVHFGMGYSRYIRERRVNAARQLLRDEPDASILAISMETGFRSQSNFYAAFREITGQSPGDYRKSLN